MKPNTEYAIMSFTCEQCGAKLEAHTPSVRTPSGNYRKSRMAQVECPRCKTKQGAFPDTVIRVVERED